MNDDERYESWEDAIKHIMRVTGRNRRQARSMLVEAMKDGRVRCRGDRGFGQEPIPKEFWQEVLPSEH